MYESARIRSAFRATYPPSLLAARRMLRENDAPIAGIALACGTCDQSAFTRQFKAVTGLTPAQYRDGP